MPILRLRVPLYTTGALDGSAVSESGSDVQKLILYMVKWYAIRLQTPGQYTI